MSSIIKVEQKRGAQLIWTWLWTQSECKGIIHDSGQLQKSVKNEFAIAKTARMH